MGNLQTLHAADPGSAVPPPMTSPPMEPQSPPTSQEIVANISNNPGVFEDLHKKCKGK